MCCEAQLILDCRDSELRGKVEATELVSPRTPFAVLCICRNLAIRFQPFL